MELPKYQLYGQDNQQVEEMLLPSLELRGWSSLSPQEKDIMLAELTNGGWLSDESFEILRTIHYLNKHYLRRLPGKRLHAAFRNEKNPFPLNKQARMDFIEIFLHEKSEEMVLRALSCFVGEHIDKNDYGFADRATNEKDRADWLERAYRKFDRISVCLNHIFEQFSINQLVTRTGFVPRQDQRISQGIYEPVILALSDPKWKNLNYDLARMFEDYRDQKYPEVITKAHGAVHRFLQIIAGEEGRSGKGEVAKLFQDAKSTGLIPVNRFTEPLIGVIQGYISSERATNSTAKPALKSATGSDALLMMNVVMVFLQYCLQNIK